VKEGSNEENVRNKIVRHSHLLPYEKDIKWIRCNELSCKLNDIILVDSETCLNGKRVLYYALNVITIKSKFS